MALRSDVSTGRVFLRRSQKCVDTHCFSPIVSHGEPTSPSSEANQPHRVCVIKRVAPFDKYIVFPHCGDRWGDEERERQEREEREIGPRQSSGGKGSSATARHSCARHAKIRPERVSLGKQHTRMAHNETRRPVKCRSSREDFGLATTVV
jgi:hypothetical protein